MKWSAVWVRLARKVIELIGIVIVAHGGLAGEYLLAMEHVVGKHEGTRAVSILATDDLDLKQIEICQAVSDVDSGGGVVVVVDMFGGTPSNLAIRACGPGPRKVLYGANLPMLVKLAKSRNMSLDESVRCARDAGRKYLDSMQPSAGKTN